MFLVVCWTTSQTVSCCDPSRSLYNINFYSSFFNNQYIFFPQWLTSLMFQLWFHLQRYCKNFPPILWAKHCGTEQTMVNRLLKLALSRLLAERTQTNLITFAAKFYSTATTREHKTFPRVQLLAAVCTCIQNLNRIVSFPVYFTQPTMSINCTTGLVSITYSDVFWKITVVIFSQWQRGKLFLRSVYVLAALSTVSLIQSLESLSAPLVKRQWSEQQWTCCVSCAWAVLNWIVVCVHRDIYFVVNCNSSTIKCNIFLNNKLSGFN